MEFYHEISKATFLEPSEAVFNFYNGFNQIER
ncbi:hypothetical protein CFP56_006713 [Quercus suber]|uniref:Uncharacterized protein n=1 Tax=Quercus suber TaxID=58331 RepID=A0AAW0IE65_QUESU